MWIYICAVAVVLLVWLLSRALKENSKAPACPGPSGLPIIGNAHQLANDRIHFTLTEMAQQHGPIYKLKLLTDHWIVVNTYDLVREVCINKGQDFSGRPEAYRFTEAVRGCHLYLLGDLTEEAKLTRNLMAKSHLTRTSDQWNESVNFIMMGDLFDKWVEKNVVTDVDDVTYYQSCKPDIFRFTCRLLVKGYLGLDCEQDSKEIDHILELESCMAGSLGSNSSGLMLDFFPWLRFFGNNEWKGINKSFRMARDLFVFYKSRIMSSVNDGETQTPMQVVLNQISQENSGMTDAFAQGLMTTLIGAGVSTTAIMLHVILVVLAEHPNIVEKINQEIDDVIGNNTPDINDGDKLPYAMATIVEVLRNASIAPVALPHKTICDTSISVYDIPKGVNVFINLWAINHDADFWEDPFVYKPERFLTSGGELLPPDHLKLRRATMSFGAGTRSCVAEAFVKKQLFLFAVCLCRRFRLKLKEKGSSDPRTFVLDGINAGPRECGIQFVSRY